MEYSINTEKNWNTTVSVTVTKEDVQAQFDKALKNVQKDARIEGFRKGKVPPQLIKKLYGPQIEAEANQLCIENAWTTVFDEIDLHVMNEPKVTNLNDTDSGGLTFRQRYPFLRAADLLQEAVELVGADKIAWGSDYPRPGLVADSSYREQLEFITAECRFLSDGQREQILSGTALRVYAWDG